MFCVKACGSTPLKLLATEWMEPRAVHKSPCFIACFRQFNILMSVLQIRSDYIAISQNPWDWLLNASLENEIHYHYFTSYHWSIFNHKAGDKPNAVKSRIVNCSIIIETRPRSWGQAAWAGLYTFHSSTLEPVKPSTQVSWDFCQVSWLTATRNYRDCSFKGILHKVLFCFCRW